MNKMLVADKPNPCVSASIFVTDRSCACNKIEVLRSASE